MCGRFALTISPKVLKELFQLADAPPLESRYNIEPSQPVAAVIQQQADTPRILKMLQWGLLPHWSKDPAVRFINARCETAHQKPTFKHAFRNHRCLIPADGFFEWQKRAGKKQPFFFRHRETTPLALAGLWEKWTDPDGSIIESCAILTTNCNELMQPIHDRMPVIIEPKNFDLWLDTSLYRPDFLQNIFKPYPPDKMTCFPVTTLVNNPKNNLSQCLEPLKIEQKPEKGLFDT